MLPDETPRQRARWTPPRGISMRVNPTTGRHEVFWREADGRQHKRVHRTHAEAERFARELAQRLAMHGRAGLSGMDAESMRGWEAVREALGGAPLAALLACWAKHRAAFCGGVSVAEAVERYLALTEAEAAHGRDQRRHVVKVAERFVARFGAAPLPSITADDVRAWLSDMSETHGLGADARNLHLRQVRAIYNRAVREGWCESNPAGAVAKVAITRDEVSVLSAEDAARLFESNRDEPVSLRLALEAFGGIRTSGTSRLSRDDFRLDERGFLLPAKSAKGAAGKQRRHYAEGLPENLWAWVRRWWDVTAAWNMTAAQTMHAKSAAFARAGVPNPKNVLRHSFASYHVALHRDAAKTALLMQHTSQLVLWQHYKGVATKADAERYFAIVP